ncbi:MAG: hypothetical protein JO232_09900 [Verrucomicrobia bacterium]|jgi:hypothetical protein|nr:hypothetical protein [Verrucomicrobiota bacterium]
MGRLFFALFKLGVLAVILVCLFPSLTSFVTGPLASLHSAAQSGTLTGNRLVDRGVGALPMKAVIDGINQFPSWAKAKGQALPGQFAPLDSRVANQIPDVTSR